MASDWGAKWTGAVTAAEAKRPSVPEAASTVAADPYDLGSTVFGGFLQSAGSSLFEMFGQDASKEALKFREANPIAGVVSEMAALAVPYAGVFKLSQGAKAASLLERGVQRLVPKALEQTGRAGVAREVLRYAPLELGRLGVGFATAPSENYGDLFADVALSTAITGGFGGIGGFLKAAGKVAPKLGRVIDSNPDLADTFTLRNLRAGGDVTGDIGKEEFERQLINSVLMEQPHMNVPKGVKARYVVSMDEGTPAGDELVNSLFRVKGEANAKLTGIDKRVLAEGPATDKLTLDAGEQAKVLGAMGFKDVGEMAETLRYARQVTVNSRRAAGALAQAIEENPALQMVEDGVWLGRQSDNGLYIGIKRVEAAQPKVTTYTANRTKITGELPDPAFADVVGELPTQGVAPAFLGKDGKVYSGRIGTQHFSAVSEELRTIGIDGTGFVTPDGRFLNRSEALKHVTAQGEKIKPSANMAGELDALDYREQSKLINSPMRARPAPQSVEVIPQTRTRTTQPKTFGTGKIAQGDRYIVAMTDKPQVFGREAHKVAESNVAAWARSREAFHPGLRSDMFNQTQDAILNNVTTADFAAAASQSGKKAFATKLSERLSSKAGQLTGLAGSKTLDDFGNWLYDIAQPTMFKEARSPVYGRLFSMLNLNMKVGQEKVNKIIKGVTQQTRSPIGSVLRGGDEHLPVYDGILPVGQMLARLSSAERGALVLANRSGDIAGNIARLSEQGRWTPLLDDTVKQLQELNKKVLAEDILPAFTDSSQVAKFRLLEGYFMPRVFKGDFYSQVLDDAGRVQYLATGKTNAAVQAEVAGVIGEAAERGLKWKVGEEYLKGARHAVEMEPGVLAGIDDAVNQQLAKSAETTDIIQSALRKIDAAKAPNAVQRMSRTRTPSALTHERTGIRGSADTAEYSLDDLVKQIEDHYGKLYKMAGHHAWRERWGQELQKFAKTDKTMAEDISRKADQFLGVEGPVTNTLNKMLAPALGSTLGSKPATRLAAASNNMMYNWNLAIANPTFAVLNLLQPLQTLLPQIAYLQKAPAAEIAAMYHIAPTFDAAGRATGIGGFMSPIKVLGQALRDMRSPESELKEILERATTDGTLMHSQVNEWFGANSANASSIRETFQQGGFFKGLMKVATIGAEKSEQISRMSSAAAMWRVGKYHFGLEGDGLYRFVQRGVHVTNYGYGVVDRSRMFTGPIGSTFGLFKNWQMNYIGQMMQYAGLAARGESFAPLAWQLGGALALGGIGATPLKVLADGMVKWSGSDASSSYQWMQENWHESADEIYFGLPAFLGVSLQASSIVPGTDVRNDAASLMNFTFVERMKAAGKAMGTTYAVGSAGDVNALRNPNVRDAVLNAIAPRAVFRAISATEGDYIKSMGTGYPQVRGVSATSRILHGLGLNQLEIEREQVAARELFKQQTAERSAVQSLGVLYADAMGNGDQDEMTRIVGRATAAGLPISSVLKSAASRQKRENESDLFSRFDAGKAARWKAALD